MQTSRRHLNNIDGKKFKDLEISLEIDAGKTLQQNYNNYMEAITKTINKHAPLITKTKKRITNPGMEKTHRGLKPNEGWPRGGGSNQKIMKTSWNTSTSI